MDEQGGEDVKGNQFIALLYGWVVIFGLILLTSFILGALLRFTSMDETTLTWWVTLTIGLIAFFIGGIIAGVKGKQKGWIIGAVTGLGVTLFIFLIQYLRFQQPFSVEQSLQHSGFIAAALLGGMIGVNMVVESKNKE